MREKIGLILLFILVVGWIGKCLDSCHTKPTVKAKENVTLFPVVSCSCWRKALPFSGFINRDNPDAGYEIFCKASIRNNSNQTIKNASIRVYIQTKNDYDLDSAKIRAPEDIYPPRTVIKFNLESPIENKSNFSKARCELLDFEVID
ncbi:hypothetical protein [Leptospira dzoumogneensis]|uniref:DUF3426 domain-containing protein n=1 Tax=Leptospira dzoumogneensis TaxID=2484904 RepID=A0A4Z1AAR8_9LEPT|nr:hypothetical protein [Leptospira dzoumogneensis]TGM97295.1 hypothetical protein EHR06_14180 [Leptospira dzoumogneensis]